MSPTRTVAATPQAVAEAAALLRDGGLVAFPTETVYGLGADATSDSAVAGIYAAKARPAFNPLIAHVESLAAARLQGQFDDAALALAAAFWPGPLTLVVPIAADCRVSLLARAGLDTVALRVPGNAVAQNLITALGRPIAAPSANRSGRVSPTRAEHVAADLDGRVAMILDGGPCTVGIESTIIACLAGEVRVLRAGGVPREALEAVLGHSVAAGTAPIAPGMLGGHYAPRARLRAYSNARSVGEGDAVLDFAGGLRAGGGDKPYLDLSPAGDLREAAANLYGFLRTLDQIDGVRTIVFAEIPSRGLGTAINDRLTRAAAPRDQEAD